MVDAIIGGLATQLGEMLQQQIREEIRLVRGVENDVGNLKATLDSIQAVILDAEKKQVKEANVRLWLQRLRDSLYDMDDVLADWSTALSKVQRQRRRKVFSFIPSFAKIWQRRNIALKVKELNEKLHQIAIEKQKYSFTSASSSSEATDIDRLNTTSYVEESQVHGRDVDRTNLVRKLLKDSSESESNKCLNLVSLVGMGGIGKTTLAGLAYNSPEVINHFEMRIWVVVSEPFDVLRIAKAIVEHVEGKPSELSQLELILRRLRETIEKKRYLLVLDDAWTDKFSKWEPLITSLCVGGTCSTILVTTRNERVAKCIGCNDMLRLHVLSDEECWNLFSQRAFSGRSTENLKHLQPIGRKIANKCKGLPFAAKTIGSLMRFKDTVEEWQHVLDSDMWELEKEEEAGLFPPLLLSYYALSPALKRCFSYCAIFPKDSQILADDLIQLWMAQGYLSTLQEANMEAIGRQYFKELVTRCFLDLHRGYAFDNRVIVTMHDMVHDLAMYLTENECSMMEVNSEMTPKTNPSPAAIRHLTLVTSYDISFPTSIGNTTKLHTFRLHRLRNFSRFDKSSKFPPVIFFPNLLYVKVLDISRNRFQQLPKEIGMLFNLRYLNLSYTRLMELPDTICELYRLQTLNLESCNKLEILPPRIGKLNSLRYLDLSGTPLIELPDTTCDLYSLQTLKLNDCKKLERLPPRIGKLNNLRHLEIDHTYSLAKLPKEIGKLFGLQSLTRFVLSEDMDDEKTTFNLGDLKDLNQLQGRLKLVGLGYVTSVASVLKAELNKKQLIQVSMDFDTFLPTFNPTAEVLEALELHQDVRNLRITDYSGAQFPSWIISLNNLRDLCLCDWQNCIVLPPLGKLQSLESLWMSNMDGLKQIGEEYLGVEADGNGGKEANIVLFPNLRSLYLEGMSSWEEWSVTDAVRELVEGGSLKIMPCLTYLKLINCEKLEKLPEILLEKTPMEYLSIRNCPGLHRKYGNRTHDRWPKSHVQHVKIKS